MAVRRMAAKNDFHLINLTIGGNNMEQVAVAEQAVEMTVGTLAGCILGLLAGLGLFLYGMNTMSEGLERVAGKQLKGLLGAVTKNRLTQVILGFIITVLMQSSSATTVMLVGFVNAGIMHLSQAVGIIMGANIGTTVTVLMLSVKLPFDTIFCFIGCIVLFLMMFAPKKFKGLGSVVPVIFGVGALFTGMGMVGNMQLRNYTMRKSILAEIKHSKELAEQIREELGVVTPSLNTPVRRLSGGNVQKVLVGREIASAPTVLLTAYAVRGLDINSSYTIYDLINRQKQKGVAVLYVGEDLDVLLELADRILVLCGGKVSGIVPGRGAKKRDVGMMMTRLGGKTDNE